MVSCFTFYVISYVEKDKAGKYFSTHCWLLALVLVHVPVHSRINLKFGNVGFCGEEKTGVH